MILNTITEKWVESFINRPSAAIIIETFGDNETGIQLAKHIHKSFKANNKSPLAIDFFDDSSSIGISEMRELQRSLNLRANSSNGISRVHVISDASRMTNEAQNAALKLIEELPASTVICLVVSNKKDLLPTVRSRCFNIPLLPLGPQKLNEWARVNRQDTANLKTAYQIADGNLTLISELLVNENHDLFLEIRLAKEFLAKSIFERQKVIVDIVKSKKNMDQFINSLLITAKSAMRHAPDLKDKLVWKNIVKELLFTKDLISSNVSAKLAMLRLSTII